MTAELLRHRGWLVFFRNGVVIASSRKSMTLGNALRMPIDNGNWMTEADNPGNWEMFQLTGEQKYEIMALRKSCYCSSLSDSTCDFCSSTRRTDLLKEMQTTINPHIALPPWSPKE